ncbi:MAG: diphthamide biosynthesis enzyme Dph2 [Candidatus Thorarchaeota archaeon]
MYDLELEKLQNLLIQKDYSRIAVQLPDGLLGDPLKSILEAIEDINKDIEIFVIGDPCFGACDLGVHPALAARCQALFHFGHSSFSPHLNTDSNLGLDIFYFEARVTIPVHSVLKKAIQEAQQRNFTSLGLATTVQHLHALPEIEELLGAAGFTVHVGRATRRLQRGQILGCDIGRIETILGPDIQATLFFGGGRFHALALLRKTQKPVLIADPYMEKLEILDESDLRKFYRKRYAAVHKIRTANKVGILVSTKTGQYNHKLMQQARKWLITQGKTFLVVLVSTALPHHLSNFQVDGWISTLCPRVALDDAEQYQRPIINLEELDWDEYAPSTL